MTIIRLIGSVVLFTLGVAGMLGWVLMLQAVAG